MANIHKAGTIAAALLCLVLSQRASAVTAALRFMTYGAASPRFESRLVHLQGPQAAAAATALLKCRRHSARELILHVPRDASEDLQRAIASQYGAQVRDLGAGSPAGDHLWLLTLSRGQDLQTALQGLLQDGRIIGAQPNYVYAPAEGEGQDEARPAPPDKIAAP
jgi:hypothetical protein